MAGWQYRLNGHEFKQTPRDNEGLESQAYCNPWGCRVRHDLATEQQQLAKHQPKSLFILPSYSFSLLHTFSCLFLFCQNIKHFCIMPFQSPPLFLSSVLRCAQQLSHVQLCDTMDCSLPGSSVHGDSPGKNIGVGCHALLQGNLPNPGIEPTSPALQADFLPSQPPGFQALFQDLHIY